MSAFDDQKLDVPCQKCGHKMRASVATLKRNPLLTCSSCGTQTQVHADQFKSDLNKVDRALADLKRKFG